MAKKREWQSRFRNVAWQETRGPCSRQTPSDTTPTFSWRPSASGNAPMPTGKRGRPRNPVRALHPLLGYAQVDKRRKEGRVVAVNRSIVFSVWKKTSSTAPRACGEPMAARGRNTAYVERHNLTLREENGRLSRKTLAFSKTRRDLQRPLDFWRACANFVRPHRSLPAPAPAGAGPTRWLPRTPAMAAGISDHIWTLEELLTFKHWICQPYDGSPPDAECARY